MHLLYESKGTNTASIAAGTGAVTIKPAPSASIIDVYKINLPSLRLGPFIAAVWAVGNFELAAEGNLSTTLELTPNTQLPDWMIV